jgi:hypothetical protein
MIERKQMPRAKGTKQVATYTLNDGKIYTIKELEKVTGIKRSRLYYRMRTSMDIEYLSKPVGWTINTDSKVSSYEETYSDLTPKLLKLLFGKW